MTDQAECLTCGALVANQDKHNRWHGAQRVGTAELDAVVAAQHATFQRNAEARADEPGAPPPMPTLDTGACQRCGTGTIPVDFGSVVVAHCPRCKTDDELPALKVVR